jgi:Zn-dependent protease
MRSGSFHLFRFKGIDVFLHWSWFLVAVFEIQGRTRSYSSIAWNIAEYLALFAIVMLHEFGHAFACRQVGGRANRIVLWPLGGVAYVDPPQRPGATLWSIAAGPLVNVALLPILAFLYYTWPAAQLGAVSPDLYRLVESVLTIDFGLLIFNILPVYPLDGGQILRSLLWFVMGRAHSLMAAAVIGILGSIGFIALALYRQDTWLGLISFYVLMNCWGGVQQARALLRMTKIPRRDGFACPSCHSSPPIGEYWKCNRCGQAFDSFATWAKCPRCSTQFPTVTCIDCGRQSPMNTWTGYPGSSSPQMPQTIESTENSFPK